MFVFNFPSYTLLSFSSSFRVSDSIGTFQCFRLVISHLYAFLLVLSGTCFNNNNNNYRMPFIRL